ncbi:MAG: molybdopterin-dependent oxidoreductase [Deltaproteobacteria bacterium]|nr:molybdopterin-dependent oxidoreductase [Deltaproteobacteria bacterium]MBI3076659.1 molybdopterin-dependent oxidoreductase [Deltaproteobacteria bacterium]
MSTPMLSRHRAIGGGTAAACLLTGLMFLGRLTLGVPLVPELLAEIVFARVPLALFALVLGLLGAWAKLAAFVSFVGLYLLALACWGWGTLRWVETRWPTRPWLGAWLSALVLWGVTASALLGPFGGLQGDGDLLFALGSLLVLHGAYGAALVVFSRWPAGVGQTAAAPARRRAEARDAAPAGERRKLLRSMVAAVVVLAAPGFLARLRSLAEAATATVGDLLKKIRGLPPEVTPVGKFYTVSKNLFDPAVDARTWRLKVKGLVEQPYTLTYDELKALPAVQQYATLECISNEVGGGLISNALWKGVPLRDLLNRAGIKVGSIELILRAQDGYSDSFPLKKALEPGTILAWEMNGAPLARQHGFPARVIVPGIFGMKNVKWLTELEVANYDYKGYWEVRGWSDEAIYQTMSRIDVPAPGQVDPGHPYLGGIAFAGDRGVRAVEVSLDGGKTWRRAMVKPALSPYSWVLWGLEWDPATDLPPGPHPVQVRAVDGTGAVQSAQVRPPLPDGATGYHAIRLSGKARK